MAALVVAGACTLYMSVMGLVSPDAMEKQLKSAAKKVKEIGAGIVNVAAMMPDTAKDKSKEGNRREGSHSKEY